MSHAACLWPPSACGAVFMGANTYIGNGPNFMVQGHGGGTRESPCRASSGTWLFSGAVLIPVFVVVTLVFFR